MRDLPVLVYDGDCGFCQLCVDLGYRYLPTMPRVVAWQDLDLAAYGLTVEEVEESVQLVGPYGLRASGARAVAVLLAVQRRPTWHLLGRVMLTPPVSWAAEGVYRVISRNRHRLPGASGACAVR
ncbi:thiol-disulfide oxidoreductase DCC family protein [Sphaerisporangium fuscum]|uniref:thiol-disulfide oxidoreductase DCC family protein n=1 Tax=Sphaerisporangium fuscum TaxID=2835868 RepID=UPI001BDD71AB|nr:DCC1-like thiol-disulfide oxidoreductase family protein [Sphaerisporangium fuscum]